VVPVHKVILVMHHQECESCVSVKVIADLLCHLDGSAAERDALAKALCSPGHCAVPRDANVISVHLMKQDWWQVVRATTASGPRRWNQPNKT